MDVPKKDKDYSKYNQDELVKGTKIELEHTNNPELAKQIAADHLEEFPDYYKGLKKMEDQMKKKESFKERDENETHYFDAINYKGYNIEVMSTYHQGPEGSSYEVVITSPRGKEYRDIILEDSKNAATSKAKQWVDEKMKESLKESTSVEENAQKMFGKSYKDLTPEEKEKADNAAMISFWLGEKFKGAKKEEATTNTEDEWMRKMFSKGATPDEIAGVFKVQYGRELPVSQVRYTILGPGGFAKGEESFKEATFNPMNDHDTIAKKMFGKKFDELSDDEKDQVHSEYDLDTREEKIIYSNNIGQDIWVIK